VFRHNAIVLHRDPPLPLFDQYDLNMTDHHQHHIQNGLLLAFILNGAFAVIEYAGGIYTNSSAIIADAIHDGGDALAIGMGLVLEKQSRRKSAPGFSYGYTRLPLLSAVALSLILIGSSVVMMYRGIYSVMDPSQVNSIGMLWLSVLGLVINGVAFLRIRKTGHTHAHAHDPNSNAVMLHLLEDVLGWIAVLAGSVIIYYTGWYWIDGILAIAIALFIVYNSGRNLLGTINILIQATPRHIDTQTLTGALLKIPGITSVHNLHIWSLNGTDHVATVHIVTEKSDAAGIDKIKQATEALLKENSITDITIQVDTDNSACHPGYN
jgi:cobalt-zinc-cadmium efflux system protein